MVDRPATTVSTPAKPGQPGPGTLATIARPGIDRDFPPVTDSEIAAEKQRELLQAAIDKKLIKEEEARRLAPWESNLLKNMKCIETSGGVLTVLGADGRTPDIRVKDGCVGCHIEGNVESDKNIDTMLKAAVVTKASFGGPEDGIGDMLTGNWSDEKELLMTIKADQLAGLKSFDEHGQPLDDRKLKDKYPDLDTKMESAWARMKEQNKPQATAQERLGPDQVGAGAHGNSGDDQEKVRNRLEEWASKFKCRDAADRKAVNQYMEKLQQPDLKPTDLVKASNDFLKDIASRGVPEVRRDAQGSTRSVDWALEEISRTASWFASDNGIKAEDNGKVFREFNEVKPTGPAVTPVHPGPSR